MVVFDGDGKRMSPDKLKLVCMHEETRVESNNLSKEATPVMNAPKKRKVGSNRLNERLLVEKHESKSAGKVSVRLLSKIV